MKRAFLVVLAAGLLCSQTPPSTELLSTGWRIQPAGTQVKAGSFPLASSLSPDGKFLAVISAGSPATVSVFNTATMAEASRTAANGVWQGIVFSQDGRNLYVGGGAENIIYDFALSADGSLKLSRQMPGAAAGGFISDLVISPSRNSIYALDLLRNEILVYNLQAGTLSSRYKTGRRPYQILFHPDGKSFYVSSWADASVYQYRSSTGEEIGRLRLPPHPTAMILTDRRFPEAPDSPPVRLFIAGTNTNSIFSVGIDRNDQMSQFDVVNIGFSPNLPAGMTPSALALSKDQTQLFIACSNVNAIAVADVSESRARLVGFIPTGAYPSSVRLLNDGRLAITNAHSDSLTIVPQLSDTSLAALTNQAIDLVPFDASQPAPKIPPVENAMLVTLDAKDRGTNFAKLAKEFAAVENFYPNAPGAEGMEWALNGIPSDFAQRMRGRTFAANDAANQAPAGTLLSNVRQAGMTSAEFGPEIPKELPPALPRFTLIRLAGANADRNLGQVIAMLSKSPLWPKTAVFVVADRAPLLVISPYSRRAPAPNGMFYNHSSVLRTLELIFKLRPLTVFDASARPLTDLFSATADAAPYNAETQ